MKRIVLVFVISLYISTLLSAQTATGYRIEGRVRGLRDSTVTLAHFFGHSQYIAKAKAKMDTAGRFVFEGTDALPGGLYMVLLPNRKPKIELVINGTETRFSFETDTLNVPGNLRVIGSKENEAFYAYQRQLQDYATELKAVEFQAKLRRDQASSLGLRKQAAEVQAKARTLQQRYVAKADTLLMAKLLRATQESNLPAPPKLANGKPDTAYLYTYYKNHFWDTFDFTDDRLVRTPIFQRKIDQYLQQMTVPTVDSLIAAADLIVKKSKANKEVLSYAIWYITSQYERPKTMGTDGLFVHMAETYYFTGAMPSTDSATVSTIRKRVEIVKPLLVGKTFPALRVSDTLRQTVSLDQVRADYTVLFFYDPTCAHCREAMPKLKQFATDTAAAQGIQFCAIAVDNSPTEWKKFINEWNIQHWINGYDFSFRTDYRRQFDILKTPTVYVLDKDKTIIARALPAEQVGDFMRFVRRK